MDEVDLTKMTEEEREEYFKKLRRKQTKYGGMLNE